MTMRSENIRQLVRGRDAGLDEIGERHRDIVKVVVAGFVAWSRRVQVRLSRIQMCLCWILLNVRHLSSLCNALLLLLLLLLLVLMSASSSDHSIRQSRNFLGRTGLQLLGHVVPGTQDGLDIVCEPRKQMASLVALARDVSHSDAARLCGEIEIDTASCITHVERVGEVGRSLKEKCSFCIIRESKQRRNCQDGVTHGKGWRQEKNVRESVALTGEALTVPGRI